MPKLTKPLKRSKWLEWTQAHADGPDGSPRREQNTREAPGH